jgi:hypothetical protein
VTHIDLDKLVEGVERRVGFGAGAWDSANVNPRELVAAVLAENEELIRMLCGGDMQIDLDKLEELAKAATPGPWGMETVPTSVGVCHKIGPFPGKRPDDKPRHACLYADYPSDGNQADDELKANAHLIAAANPSVILELIRMARAWLTLPNGLTEAETEATASVMGLIGKQPSAGKEGAK